MPQHIKPEPERYCKHCNGRLHRKRFPKHNRIEPMGVFLRRMYCDKDCAGLGKRMSVGNLSPGGLRHHVEREVAITGPCQMCGSALKLHRHHLNGKVADNAPQNILILCNSCHMKWHWNHTWGGKRRGTKPCVVCGTPVKAKGLCNKHYQRFLQRGDPLLMVISGRGSTQKLGRVSNDA